MLLLVVACMCPPARRLSFPHCAGTVRAATLNNVRVPWSWDPLGVIQVASLNRTITPATTDNSELCLELNAE